MLARRRQCGSRRTGRYSGIRPAARQSAAAAAETLERRYLLNAIIAPPDPVVGPVTSPLQPRPGHTFYVQGSASAWDQASAITPNVVNDLILNTAPIDTDYVPCCEALTAPNGITNPPQPNSIKLLTNGTTQSLVSAGGALDQNGSPDGGVGDPSNPTNVIADTNAPWHATYSLGASPNGYDISEIDSITGHQDFRTRQQIEVEVEPVGSSQFVPLSSGTGFAFGQTGDSPPITLNGGSAQMAIVSDRPGESIRNNWRHARG